MHSTHFSMGMSLIGALMILTLPLKAAAPVIKFDAPGTFPAGNSPNSVTIGDFDNDGFGDIALANGGYNGSTVTILKGGGNGLFRPSQTYTVGSAPQFITTGDFNSDGNLDLVVDNYSSATVS